MAILTNFWGYFLNNTRSNSLFLYLLAFFKETLSIVSAVEALACLIRFCVLCHFNDYQPTFLSVQKYHNPIYS